MNTLQKCKENAHHHYHACRCASLLHVDRQLVHCVLRASRKSLLDAKLLCKDSVQKHAVFNKSEAKPNLSSVHFPTLST